MEYWHELITEKSFKLLKEFNKLYDFILIGGWAVFLYTKTLKSKDVDIILSFEELSKMKERFPLSKNERLKKYEIKKEGTDIDIYLPYYSNPGLPAEEVEKFAVLKEGFKVPIPEALLILKQNVFEERKNSPKGEKDKIDIFSLLLLPDFDWEKYKQILKAHKKEELAENLGNLLKQTSQIKELNLSYHKMAKLKKEIIPKLKG